jgi:uncharacterized membrane protein YbhN (UPF0104 family)
MVLLRRHLPALVSLLLLGAAVLYLVLRNDQLSVVVATWRRIDTPHLVTAISLMILAQLTIAWRCRVILDGDGLREANMFWSLVRIQMVTLFAAHGAILPGFADVAKATMLKLRFDISAARSVKLVIYERICTAIGFMMVGLLATPPLFLLDVPLLLVIVPLLLWVAGLVTLAAILLLANRHISTGHARIDWFVSSFLQVGQLYHRRRSFIELFLSAFAQLLLVATTFLLLSRAMAMPIEPVFIFLLMPFIFFVASLPVFYMGWGGREAVVIMTLGALAPLPTPEALALSAAFGVAVFLASPPGALLWLMRPSMRRAVQEELSSTRAAIDPPPLVK